MEHRSRKFKSLSILFLFFVGFAFSTSMVGALSHPSLSLEQVSNKSGVKISAKYLPPKNGPSGETSFRLILSTHYVDLGKLDIQNLAFVKVDNKPPQPAAKWVASGSNHHIKGILSFPEQQLEGSQLVQLIIKDVGDASDRVFEWHAPVTN